MMLLHYGFEAESPFIQLRVNYTKFAIGLRFAVAGNPPINLSVIARIIQKRIGK
jgi:hypothetical protein